MSHLSSNYILTIVSILQYTMLLKWHILLLLQNLFLFLLLLLSLDISLYDLIYVVLYRKKRLTDNDLRYFIQVKNRKIFDILIGLQKHNQLYQDIVINYDMLENMPDEFIFKTSYLKLFYKLGLHKM